MAIVSLAKESVAWSTSSSMLRSILDNFVIPLEGYNIVLNADRLCTLARPIPLRL
jgi:hypothetical protein